MGLVEGLEDEDVALALLQGVAAPFLLPQELLDAELGVTRVWGDTLGVAELWGGGDVCRRAGGGWGRLTWRPQ